MKNPISFFALLAFLLLSFTGKAEAQSQDNIIFLHIPKSGGASVSSLLMNEYSYNQIVNSNKKKIKLYAYGFHYSLFEINKKIDTSNFKLITFIRNPIDRILSEHHYCMGKHKGNPQILLAHKLPPQGDPINTASNVACKMLSGLNDRGNKIPIKKHLAHAKKALKRKIFFVGITEEMEESIHLLYSKLGWKIPEEIPYFNQSNRKTNHFSNEVLRGIAKRNWADIELYEYALSLYEQQKISTHNKPTHSTTDFVNYCNYTFDQKLEGCGWGIREKNSENNQIYRWASNNNEAIIDFYLQPDTDYTFQCKILIQPIFYNLLTISVNDIPIPIESNISEGSQETQFKWAYCSGIIPKESLEKGNKTKITFKLIAPIDPTLLQIYKQNSHQHIMNNYTKGKFACQSIILN